MYYAAEHFHFSGVLAVVSGGLLLSSKRQAMLSYRSRIEGVNVWTSLVFVLNGLIFLLIGLQLPSISEHLGDVGLRQAIMYGLAISTLLIFTRLACTFGAAAFTKIASRFITVADPNPGWKAPLISGWAGMRGVVSLAAALSIPLLLSEGQPFPFRNLILFITFIVILVTLVFQGLTLPWLIRKVKLEDKYTNIPEERQDLIIQKKIALCSLEYLEQHHGEELSTNDHLKLLHSRLAIDSEYFQQELNEAENKLPYTLGDFQHIYLELLDHQRVLLTEMNQRSEFDEDVIRKHLSLVDMEEHKIREKLLDADINPDDQ
jgi:CPA1 family monovalent cation:H+ antiporter